MRLRGKRYLFFDQDDIGHVFEKFVIPYILDTDTRQYFEQMKWPSAKP